MAGDAMDFVGNYNTMAPKQMRSSVDLEGGMGHEVFSTTDQKYEIRTIEANVVPDAQYSPLEVASEVEALERKFDQENDNTRRIGEDIERRYNSQITRARNQGLNAQATTQELEQLGKQC